MPIMKRKHIGVVTTPPKKTGKKSKKPVRIWKDGDTVTLPDDLNMLSIHVYPPDSPMAGVRCDYVRTDEMIYSRGFGKTVQEAIHNAKPISNQRPRETPRNTVALAHNANTETTNDQSELFDADTKETTKIAEVRRPRKFIRRPSRV
jgi:hypothetical protein